MSVKRGGKGENGEIGLGKRGYLSGGPVWWNLMGHGVEWRLQKGKGIVEI